MVLKEIEQLANYAATELQRRVIDALKKRKGNVSDTARDLGIHRTTVQSHVRAVRKRAAKKDPHTHDHEAPDGYKLRGVSTLTNKEGEVVLQWSKTSEDRERMHQLQLEAISALSESITRAAPVPLDSKLPRRTDLLNMYVLTDYHLGAMAWHEETGEDWDVNIAEDLMVRWFETAIKQAPDSATAVLAQLGDFLHWDGIDAVTPTSGHLLDADTRFQKVVRIAIRAVRRIIAMLLEKHTHVHIIMAEGNHDITSSIWLREWFHAMYENEPRVTVDLNPDPWYCYTFGSTALFFHHGHKRKPIEVDEIFVAKYRKEYGESKHAYAHMGHLHNDRVVETKLMLVEQHRSLTAPDSYASRHGWHSGRDSKVITYSYEYGEVGRVTVSPDMVYAQTKMLDKKD